MKRTPLKRRTPLRRSAPMDSGRQVRTESLPALIPKVSPSRRKPRPPKKRSAYRDRERDWDRMAWCKTLPCAVSTHPPPGVVVTTCAGVIEADHQGDRAKSRKAPDDTVVPMCNGHHCERTDHRGTFATLPLELEREWRRQQIARVQQLYSVHLAGVSAGTF